MVTLKNMVVGQSMVVGAEDLESFLKKAGVNSSVTPNPVDKGTRAVVTPSIGRRRE